MKAKASEFARIVLLAFAIAVLSTGCHRIVATPISEVNKSPANFDGKEVILHGVVKEPTRIPLINLKSYVLKDDSGEIIILTGGNLPRADEELSVKVKVENLAIINGEPVGTTITEIARP
ncbi:MAG TPA: hypothetical protein VEG38_08580 [Acidimicrobiia bacterium]|nr:hypothetical protein [Acidimicrobiia bacterium]